MNSELTLCIKVEFCGLVGVIEYTFEQVWGPEVKTQYHQKTNKQEKVELSVLFVLLFSQVFSIVD
jgi:hypothetical protein